MILTKYEKRPDRQTNPEGTSIIIALIIGMVMIYFAASAATITTTALKETAAFNAADEAFYNAESALEEGIYAYYHGGGTNFQQEYAADFSTEITKDKPKTASWKIMGLAGTKLSAPIIVTGLTTTQETPSTQATDAEVKTLADNEYYAFPAPGTGTAGGKDCDPFKPTNTPDEWTKFIEPLETVLKEKGVTGSFGNGAEDHPCNWNKIEYGQPPVEIPLYGADPVNPSVKVPLIFDEFIVRVRTPCVETVETAGAGANEPTSKKLSTTSICPITSRPDLKSEADWEYMDYKPNPDDMVMNWIFLWKCEDGSECYLIPPTFEEQKKGKPGQGKEESVMYKLSTILSSEINRNRTKQTEKSFIFELLSVINENFKGIDKIQTLLKVTELLSPLPPKNPPKNLIFKLSVIKPLQSEEENIQIPYLEYQILYKPQGELGETITPIVGNPTIVAEGYSGGFKQTLKANLSKSSGTFDFAVQN